MISLIESKKTTKEICYTGIDAFTINIEEHNLLNYCGFLNNEYCKKMFYTQKEKSILTTYSLKEGVRCAMQSVGFSVVKEQVPPGKGEMLMRTIPPISD